MLGNYRDKLDDKHTVHSEYLVACKMKTTTKNFQGFFLILNAF